MNKVESRNQVTANFPAGEYYIGDLCYVLTESEWGELLQQCIDRDTNQCYDGEFIVSDIRIFMASTAYGDGCFEDNLHRKYGVDSGSIGFCPTSMISKEKLEEIKESNLGQIENIESDFRIDVDNGYFEIIVSGWQPYLVINTQGEDEEEEYDSYDDYYYYDEEEEDNEYGCF